jgi:hypothetical protein
MKFEDALKALRDGKKIRLSHWRNDHYWEIGAHGSIENEDGESLFNANWLMSEEWEVVEETTMPCKIDWKKEILDTNSTLITLLRNEIVDTNRRLEKIEESLNVTD